MQPALWYTRAVRSWIAKLPRRGDMVVPLRFAGVLGLAFMLPAITSAFGTLVDALINVNWSPDRSGGYFHVIFTNVPSAIAAEGTRDVVRMLLSFTSAAFCLVLLSRGRLFWSIVRRFRP